MKKHLLLFSMFSLVALMSVSAGAESPPFQDEGLVESKIEQLPVAEIMPGDCFTITSYEFDALCSISEVLYYDNPDVKRYPVVQPACVADAPGLGVDGRAVLSWCSLGTIYNRPIDIATRYAKGRATEYRC